MKLKMRIEIVCLIVLQLVVVDSSKIFIFMGYFTSHSPTASIQPLADKLAERGHKVTLYSPIWLPDRNPSIQMFCPDKMKAEYKKFNEEWGKASAQSRSDESMNPFTFRQFMLEAFDYSHYGCKLLLEQPELKELMQREEYDLVIVDNIFHECGYALAYHFKAKTIYYGAAGSVLPYDHEMFGLPAELSWVPGFASSFDDEGNLSFYDRLSNAITIFMLSSLYRSHHLPRLEQIVRDSPIWGPSFDGMPPLEKLVQNASLLLINQHFSDQFPKSRPASVILVGGMHVQPRNGTLSKELESFIGDSNFIYVSFGSYVKVSAMPPEITGAFFDAFGSSKVKFLWKWDGTPPANAPSNILFKNWFNQQNVLGHPKIRGFFTQGGQISIAQGACHGVPLVVLPVEGDQNYNAMRMKQTGNALVLNLAKVTKSILEGALRTILDDPVIRDNAKAVEAACRDRPMSPVDTAVWWTEWVLRTPDTSILKPKSMSQPLWIQWSLDLWSFIIVSILLISFISLIVLKFLIVKILSCFRKQKGSERGQKKIKKSLNKLN